MPRQIMVIGCLAALALSATAATGHEGKGPHEGKGKNSLRVQCHKGWGYYKEMNPGLTDQDRPQYLADCLAQRIPVPVRPKVR